MGKIWSGNVPNDAINLMSGAHNYKSEKWRLKCLRTKQSSLQMWTICLQMKSYNLFRKKFYPLHWIHISVFPNNYEYAKDLNLICFALILCFVFHLKWKMLLKVIFISNYLELWSYTNKFSCIEKNQLIRQKNVTF